MNTEPPEPQELEESIATLIENRLTAIRMPRKRLYTVVGSRSTFERSMDGSRSFTISELVRIAKVLDVEFEDLIPAHLKRRQRNAA